MAITGAQNSPTDHWHKQGSNSSKMCSQPTMMNITSQHDYGPIDTPELIHECEHDQSQYHQECDACPYCQDVCSAPECSRCSRAGACYPFSSPEHFYTICQVKRHCTDTSAWLVVGDVIYDATFYISRHPGGAESILKKSGGKSDCAVDFEFHSKKAREMWKKHKIGKLRPCANSGNQFGVDDQCTIS